jgi:beta-glucosidase
MQLSRYDLSYWNVVTQTWYVAQGTITVYIGASSRDIRLTGSLVVS